MAFWVIGNATKDPWPLSIEPYKDSSEAQRAINWQFRGNPGDPADYWQIVNTQQLRDLFPIMTRSPYTEAAWAKFKENLYAEDT